MAQQIVGMGWRLSLEGVDRYIQHRVQSRVEYWERTSMKGPPWPADEPLPTREELERRLALARSLTERRHLLEAVADRVFAQPGTKPGTAASQEPRSRVDQVADKILEVVVKRYRRR